MDALLRDQDESAACGLSSRLETAKVNAGRGRSISLAASVPRHAMRSRGTQRRILELAHETPVYRVNREVHVRGGRQLESDLRRAAEWVRRRRVQSDTRGRDGRQRFDSGR